MSSLVFFLFLLTSPHLIRCSPTPHSSGTASSMLHAIRDCDTPTPRWCHSWNPFRCLKTETITLIQQVTTTVYAPAETRHVQPLVTIPCEVCTTSVHLQPSVTASSSSSSSSASSSVDGPGTVVGRRTAISEVTTYPGPVVLTAQPNFLRRDNDPIAFLYCGCGCIFQSGYS